MQIREPFDYARACLVLVAALALAGGLAVADVLCRTWKKVAR